MHFIPSFTLEGFYLGPAYIYTWGLTAAIGVLVAIWMVEKKVVSGQWSVVSRMITEDKFWSLAILLIISIFLGARVSYILETWSYYTADPLAALRLWEGGFSFFGGVAGGLLASWIWSKKYKIDFLHLGWIFTPAWLFGLFFGRIGCFLIHDHLGKPTNLPWGIFIQGAYRHEPALHEVLWVLLIIIILKIIDGYKIKPSFYCHPERSRGIPLKNSLYEAKNISILSRVSLKGISPLWSPEATSGRNDNFKDSAYTFKILFPLSLLLYSLGRFFIDFTRADDPFYFWLTVAQWFCIIAFIGCGVVLIKLKKNQDKAE